MSMTYSIAIVSSQLLLIILIVTMAGCVNDDELFNDAERAGIEMLLPKLEVISCSIDCECCYCGSVMLMSWQLPCKHLICGHCWVLLSQQSKLAHSVCYVDGAAYALSKVVRRDVKQVANLRVFCRNRVLGCMDTFTLKTIGTHLDNCLYSTDRIPKSIKQTMDLPSRSQFSEKWEEFISPLKARGNETNPPPSKPIDPEEDFVDINQPFHNFLQQLQEQLDNQLDKGQFVKERSPLSVEHHSDNDEQDDLEPIVHFKSSNIDQIKVEIKRKKDKNSFNWTIDDFENKLQLDQIVSDWFAIGPSKFGLKFVINEDHLLPLMTSQGEIIDGQLRHHRRTLSIQDLSRGKRNIERVEEPSFGSCSQDGCDVIFPFQPIALSLLRDCYVRDNCLKVNLKVESLSLLFKSIPKSYRFDKRQSIVHYKWSIENVRDKMAAVKDGVSCHVAKSGYFYSSPQGYRMQATMDIRDNWLAVYLDFLIGEWDGQLPDYFGHVVTFAAATLKDKNGNSVVKHCVDEEGHLYGDRIDHFVPIDVIESLSLKESRTLTIKISVQER